MAAARSSSGGAPASTALASVSVAVRSNGSAPEICVSRAVNVTRSGPIATPRTSNHASMRPRHGLTPTWTTSPTATPPRAASPIYASCRQRFRRQGRSGPTRSPRPCPLALTGSYSASSAPAHESGSFRSPQRSAPRHDARPGSTRRQRDGDQHSRPSLWRCSHARTAPAGSAPEPTKTEPSRPASASSATSRCF